MKELLHGKIAQIVGSEFFNGIIKVEYSDDLTAAGAFTVFTTQFRQSSQAYACYFDGIYHLTDNLAVDFGGRYSHDRKTVSDSQTSVIPAYVFPPDMASADFSAFTPRVSVRYQLDPLTDVYASFSEGYRTGGFNFSPPLNHTPFQPESVDAYEVGFKTNRSWYQFDSAVFYYDYKNLQVGVVEQGSGGGAVDVVANAKAARLYGWDNDITVHPIEHLSFRVGVSLLHARYTDFDNAQGTGLCVVSTAALPCTPGTDIAETQNLKGKQMIRVLDVSGFVGGDYEFQSVFNGKLDVALNATYTDSAPTEHASVYGPADPAEAGTERYVAASYTILNGEISWRDQSGHYKVTVWGRNLTNKLYRIVDSGYPVTGDFQSFGEPVSYGFRVGYSF